MLDRIERLCIIERIERERAHETPAAINARAEAAMRRMWPGWR